MLSESPANRLDPEEILMGINETDHHRAGRSSSAAKKAEAAFRISLALRSSAISLRSLRFSAAISLVGPGVSPWSMAACLCHFRRVSGPMPRRSPMFRHAV